MQSPQQWSRCIRGQRESEGMQNSRWREGKMRPREACSESISSLDWDTYPTNLAVHLLSQTHIFSDTIRLVQQHLTVSFLSSQSCPRLHLLKIQKHNSYLSHLNTSATGATVRTIICTSCQIRLRENLKSDGVSHAYANTHTQSVWLCPNAQTELFNHNKNNRQFSSLHAHMCTCTWKHTNTACVCAWMINILCKSRDAVGNLHTTELNTGIIINQLKILMDDKTVNVGSVRMKHVLSFT